MDNNEEQPVTHETNKPKQRDWLTGLSAISLVLAAIMLIAMTNFPSFFFTGIIVGLAAAVLDFGMEYKGISRMEWGYTSNRFSLKGVPLQLPALFFSTGVAVTFMLDTYVQPMVHLDFFSLAAEPVGFVQIILLVLGGTFLALYLAGKTRALMLGALPVGLAVYLWFPEPWFLVLSLIPVYVDYYLERRMTRTGEITYDGFNEEMAVNTALCYFPIAMFLFSSAILLNNWLAGFM
jgi:hypothetical protein